MLSPLLAVLLCAASDSASSTDLLAQRAADSAALERISPLPATTESPTKVPRSQEAYHSPELVDSEAPLDQGSIGIGFRVLGDAPLLHLQLAVSSSNFVRLRGAFSQRSETHSRNLTETLVYSGGLVSKTNSATIDVEQSTTEWEVQLAMGGLGFCQGSLCGSWSVGPFLGRTISTLENTEVQTLDFQIRDRRLDKRVGVAGTLGLVWEFRKGLALSADVGASMARVSGERSMVYKNSNSDPVTQFKSEDDPEGSEIAVNLVGVGLDAWF